MKKFISILMAFLLLISLTYAETSGSADGDSSDTISTPIVSGGGSGGSSSSSGGGGATSTSPVLYSKTCTYIWDSTPYLNQRIEIMASITDERGNKNSNSISPMVVENNPWTAEYATSSLSGKSLEIRIIEPKEGEVSGAVEIKIYAQSPYELEDMTLSFSGEGLEESFSISNKNCAEGATSEGSSNMQPPIEVESGVIDSSGSSSCEKYYTCPDGKEVQYCFIHKFYSDDGEITGVGCGCKNPKTLCPLEAEAVPIEVIASGEEPVPIPSGSVIEVTSSSAESGGLGSNENPVICDGCILGDKCAPIGYRIKGRYCSLNSEFADYLEEGQNCENNFECDTNICENNQCGKYCEGCKDENNKCIPFSTRLGDGTYCDVDKSMKPQKSEDESCNNNYECSTNVCVNNKCISQNVIQKVINWFKRLFG